MPIILGYPLINWYIGFVLFGLFCLFVKIHIITPQGPHQTWIIKNLPVNGENKDIIWDEIFKLEDGSVSISFFNTFRNMLGDIFLCITPLVLIYWIVKKFIKKNDFNAANKKSFTAYTLVNVSIFFLIFAIMAYIAVAYRYDMINTVVQIELYRDLYNLDLYSITIKVMILLTSIFILHNSRTYILLHSSQMLEFTVLLTLAIFFLSVLVSSNDLMVMFISIIGFSLNMYVLLMSDFDRRASLEAGIKYFYLSAFSSGLLISGIWLCYIIFFNTHFIDIRLILEQWLRLPENPILANQGILQIMIYSIVYGFLFKLAAFPCHLWAPEVYEGSPNPIMAFFILPVKIAVFAVFIRLITNIFKDIYSLSSYILWFSAWTSMLWGCYGAFTELKLRKFIAFSSINQMGFLLIGVSCGTFIGIRATLIYLFIYVIMNCGFLQIFLTTYADKNNLTLDFITDFKYFARDNKLLAVLLITILFSMAGIPPLAGFFGKYFLFAASIKSGYYFLVIIGMLTSLISTFYYIRIIKVMWFDEQHTILPSIKFINTMDRPGRLTYFSLIVFIILFILFINSIFSFANLITISCLMLLIFSFSS